VISLLEGVQEAAMKIPPAPVEISPAEDEPPFIPLFTAALVRLHKYCPYVLVSLAKYCP
jgi:hypothetical protein